MPDLFTFELTDLYDKKNIPKVIYSIHALTFILAGENLAPSIGNLIGKLEFTEDEINQTRRGLDAAGVSMPNFNAMNQHFDEPEPEPYTEEELMAMELEEAEDNIVELQAVCRGFLVRSEIATHKCMLQRVESRITALQAIARGGNVRQGISESMDAFGSREEEMLARLQGVCRGILLRRKRGDLSQVLDLELESVVAFQSVFRGNTLRNRLGDVRILLLSEAQSVTELQSVIRAVKARKEFLDKKSSLESLGPQISKLQAIVRGTLSRQGYSRAQDTMHDNEAWISKLQTGARGYLARQRVMVQKVGLAACSADILELQSMARGSLVRRRQDSKITELCTCEDDILTLQSVFRAGKVRSAISQDKERLEILSPSIVRIQSIFRGILVRYDYSLMLEELEECTEEAIQLQACIRGALVRKEFQKRMEFFRQNLDKVIKIQSFVRAKKQGDAYKSLTTGSNPPLSTVKSFVHLLNDSDLDFEQEVELEKSRKLVIDEVRKNEQLEQFITQMDVKIALLLKNKITLDEVVRHRNKGVPSQGLMSGATDMFDLKALNKASRRRLELYQGLFYIIQTQPAYLARLFQKLAENPIHDKVAKDIESLVMRIFGYAQKRREQFFLMNLISRCIYQGMEGCDSPRTFTRTHFVWWKLVSALSKGSQERRKLSGLLEDYVDMIVSDPSMDLESDPLSIYRSSINNEELRTGRLSSRNPNLAVDEAVQDPETRATFISNLQRLRELTGDFLTRLENNVDSIPYHMRLTARETYWAAKWRFKADGITEDAALSLIGFVIFTNYLNPAITGADSFGIVPHALGPQQAKNLGEVARMLGQIASLRPFSSENVFLQPLNEFVKSCIGRARVLFKRIIDVPTPEQEFEMNVFDDLTSHQRPKLYIKTSEIFAVHQMICQELQFIAPESNDALRDVIKQLGSLPNDASEILDIARFTEVKLDLNPSFAKMEDSEAEMNSLLVAAKRCLIYVVRVQTGASLLEILLSPVLPQHEEKYRAILHEERIERNKRAQSDLGASTSSNEALGDLSRLTYRELKLLALEKIIELESMGRITREDNYQEMLNSIALDIRTKRNRRAAREKEMESIRQTLAHLNEKEKYLQNQLKTYNDYIEQAMNTLQSKKGKKKNIFLPFSKQYFHMRELQRSGKVPQFGSYKYSASNLFDKGILVELNGYNDRQYGQVAFTFSSDEIGVFNIEAAFNSITLPGASTNLTLDDLLGQQYNNKPYIELFDGMVKLNTNLTLHFIFKKFYGDNK